MRSERELRGQICEAGRVLYERGHNAPPDGNISARLSDRHLLCTPSMCHKGRLSAADIVKVDAMDGRPVVSRQRASSEIRMHLAIYRARPDVDAIVHAHSPNAVGLTVAGISMERPVVPEAILALGGVPTVPYASPTTADLPDAVAAYVREANAFILERHGPVALGTSIAEALSRLEIVEHTAKITIAALAAGSATPIPAREASHLRELAVPKPDADSDLDALIDHIAARVTTRLSPDT
jgi:L-fuculose-phosphate aldolase